MKIEKSSEKLIEKWDDENEIFVCFFCQQLYKKPKCEPLKWNYKKKNLNILIFIFASIKRAKSFFMVNDVIIK